MRIYFEEACPYNQAGDRERAKHWVQGHYGKSVSDQIDRGLIGVELIPADRSCTFLTGVQTLTQLSSIIESLKASTLEGCFILADNPICMVYYPLEYCESKDEALLLSQIAYELLSKWQSEGFIISMSNPLNERDELEVDKTSYAHPSHSSFAVTTQHNKLTHTTDFSFQQRINK